MNGFGWGGMSLLTSGLTRSVSPENPTGAPGGGGAATHGTGAAAARAWPGPASSGISG